MILFFTLGLWQGHLQMENGDRTIDDGMGERGTVKMRNEMVFYIYGQIWSVS